MAHNIMVACRRHPVADLTTAIHSLGSHQRGPLERHLRACTSRGRRSRRWTWRRSARMRPSRTWVQHPDFDAYWRPLADQEQIAKIDMPKLVITGARDGDQGGTLSFYKDVVDNNGGKQPADYFLVVGPPGPGGALRSQARRGRPRAFRPRAGVLDVRLHVPSGTAGQWRAVLGRLLREERRLLRHQSEAECWKFADLSLSDATTPPDALFQRRGRGGRPLSAQAPCRRTPRARWAAPGSRTQPQRGRSEARAAGGRSARRRPGVPHRALLNTEIDGRIALDLSLAIGRPDADIGYDLFLITPDGKAHELDGGDLHARHLRQLEHAELVKPGEIDRYHLDDGQWFATRAPRARACA